MPRYGSLFNQLMDNTEAREPQVGDGATILMWSDRHAATIVEISRFKTGKRAGQISAITVQEDKATRIDNWGMSDMQDYTYEADPTGSKKTFKVDARGQFKGLLVGTRKHYYDFSF